MMTPTNIARVIVAARAALAHLETRQSYDRPPALHQQLADALAAIDQPERTEQQTPLILE